MKCRRRAPLVVSVTLAAAFGVLVPGCADDLDTRRPNTTLTTTLGEDVFAVLCDRVGASTLPEDIEGASYNSICHKSPRGWGHEVDTSHLPPVDRAPATIERNRELAIAKLDAMVRNRDEIVRAVDALVPDITIDDPFAPASGPKSVRLHAAMADLLGRMAPLYDDLPGGQRGAIPATTAGLGRMLGAVFASDRAQAALAKIGGRQGYLPLDQALRVARPALTYPGLRSLARRTLARVGEGGAAAAPFRQLLDVVRQEMRAYAPTPAGALVVDDSRLQPNRPRSALELARALLLEDDNAYLIPGSRPLFVTGRDARGFALPAGWAPGQPLGVGGPFADLDGDGYPDVDALGRFLGSNGAPSLAPPPFATPGALVADGYSFDAATGRALGPGGLVYSYIDTSRTFLAPALRDALPLVSPTSDGGASAMMKAFAGVIPLLGNRLSTTHGYDASDAEGHVDLAYNAFDPSTSPLPDLAYAAGQLLASPEGDDYLGFLLDLHAKRPEVTARAAALAWSIREESKKPAYAEARLSPNSALWDDLAAWLAKATRVGPDHFLATAPTPNGQQPRGLLSDLILAFGDSRVRANLPTALAPLFQYKDRLTLDTSNVNGPPMDLDAGYPLGLGQTFVQRVDRGAPDDESNGSNFYRFAKLIHLTNHVNTCNKQGMSLSSHLCGIPITYPTFVQRAVDECGMYEVRELAAFYVSSMLPYDHPRRSRFTIKDGFLTGITDLLPCGTFDDVLENTSGIRGLRTIPTPQALARLVFFGADADQFLEQQPPQQPPDRDPNADGSNATINAYLRGTMNPIGTINCPPDAYGVQVCSSFSDTARGSIPNTLFLTETPYLPTHGEGYQGADRDAPSSVFMEGMRPLFTTFANYDFDPSPSDVCDIDPASGRCPGVMLFTELMDILYKHWPTSASGAARYEELLAWVVGQSDMFGTAAELGTALRDQAYSSPRPRNGQARSGLDVLTAAASFVFDPARAAAIGVTDRNGQTTALRSDGAAKPLAVFDLFASALRASDARYDESDDARARHAAMKEARSTIVDTFLAASPQGTWQNTAFSRALLTIGKLTREQVNAHCPDRELSATTCPWARTELPSAIADTTGGPLFAATVDFVEALRQDDATRIEAERFLAYLLTTTNDIDALSVTTATIADMLQVLVDDETMPPLVNAASAALARGDGGERATVDASLDVLRAMLDDHDDLPPDQARDAMVDRYHMLETLLRNLVTPMAPGGRTPLQVFADVTGDVHRIDSTEQGPLTAADYKAASQGLRSFLTDKYRGMEQFPHTIVRGRNGE